MLEGYSPVSQALLGTLFTWGLTAAGAAMVFVFSGRQVRALSPHTSRGTVGRRPRPHPGGKVCSGLLA